MCHVGSLLPLSMRTEAVQDHPGTEAWMRAPRGRKHNFFFFPRLLPRGGGPTLRFRLGSPLRGALLANTRREDRAGQDRKSTRLNSSHSQISYAVFCLKKKKNSFASLNRRLLVDVAESPSLRYRLLLMHYILPDTKGTAKLISYLIAAMRHAVRMSKT